MPASINCVWSGCAMDAGNHAKTPPAPLPNGCVVPCTCACTIAARSPCRPRDTASVTRTNDGPAPQEDDGPIKQASTVFPGGTAMTSSAHTARLASVVSAALALLALLLVPAIGHAKTSTFGIRLDHEPSNSAPGHNCKEDGSDDPTPACTRVAIDVGDAIPGGLTAPMNGTIVKFRVRAGAPGDLTFRLAQLRNLGFDPSIGDYLGYGKGVGTGPTVHVAGRGFDETNPVEEFPAHLKVHKGDYLGIDSTSTSVLYCASGGSKQLIFTPTLGGSFVASSTAGGCGRGGEAGMKAAARGDQGGDQRGGDTCARTRQAAREP